MPRVYLKTPIVGADGRQYAVIDIDEPTIGGIAAHEIGMIETGSDTFALIQLLIAETGWPSEVVRKIRVSDLEAVSELVRPFVSGAESGATGEKSSPTSPTS